MGERALIFFACVSFMPPSFVSCCESDPSLFVGEFPQLSPTR